MVDKLLNGSGMMLLNNLITSNRTRQDGKIKAGSLINIEYAVDDINRSIQELLISDESPLLKSELAGLIAGKCLQYRTLLEHDSHGRFIVPMIGQVYVEAFNAFSYLLDDLQTFFNVQIPIKMTQAKARTDTWTVSLPHQIWSF